MRNIQKGDEIEYRNAQGRAWGKATHDLVEGQDSIEVESLITPLLTYHVSLEQIIAVHRIEPGTGVITMADSASTMKQTVIDGLLQLQWTEEGSERVKRFTSEETVNLLHLLFNHRSEILARSHQEG